MSGTETKEKILRVAEKLFAEKGFDGTSVDSIAKTAGVNKALIYYHFKDKSSLVAALAEKIVAELDGYLRGVFENSMSQDSKASLKDKIEEEIAFMGEHRGILSVLLMESLKASDNSRFLFQGAEYLIRCELRSREGRSLEKLKQKQQYLVHEFFTGFIPVLVFVSLRQKWCEYFQCDESALLKHFIDAFERTHLRNHPIPR